MCERESLRGIPPTLDRRRHAASKAVNVTVRSARPREYLTECEIDKLIDAACGAHHRRSLGIHSGLCGCEKFELPNFGAGLHRKPLFTLICALQQKRIR